MVDWRRWRQRDIYKGMEREGRKDAGGVKGLGESLAHEEWDRSVQRVHALIPVYGVPRLTSVCQAKLPARIPELEEPLRCLMLKQGATGMHPSRLHQLNFSNSRSL